MTSSIQSAQDRTRRIQSLHDLHWGKRKGPKLPLEKFPDFKEIWCEVGSGTGKFFETLAKENASTLFLASERDRMRGRALEHRARRAKLPNFVALRGNIVPTLTQAPSASFDRIYILYPCPFPKISQRKNRWYNHPLMPHLVRTLKPKGLLVWASDQAFYIEEARYVCEQLLGLSIISTGPIAAGPGRTKFEAEFLTHGQPCFELICSK